MRYEPPTNVSTSTDMFRWINDSVATSNGTGLFFPGMIIATFIIAFVKMLGNQNSTVGKSFAASSFICMIVSVFCRILGFVDTSFMSLFILFTAVGAIWMHIENKS